jgi:hypothetical protein
MPQAYDGTGAALFTLDPEYRDDELLIPSKQSAEFYDPISPQTLSSHVMHARLNTAGSHGVTIAFVGAGSTGFRHDLNHLADLPAEVSPVFISNAAILHVAAPSGVDAEVLKLISSASSGEGWLRISLPNRISIARTIRTNYPASRYALTFGTLLPPGDPQAERDAVLATLEQRAPRGPLIDWFRLEAAAAHLHRQSKYLLTDVSISLDEVDKIRDACTNLTRDASNDIVRRLAQKELSEFPQSRESVLAAVADLNAKRATKGAPPRLIPIVQCVRAAQVKAGRSSLATSIPARPPPFSRPVPTISFIPDRLIRDSQRNLRLGNI